MTTWTSLLLAMPPPPTVPGAGPPQWMAWVGAGGGLLLALLGVLWCARLLPRLRRARTTTGEVVAVGRESGSEGRVMWRLTVAFTDAEGRRRDGLWVGQSSLDLTVYRPGMTVPVRYDRASGSVIDLPGGRRPPALLVPALLVPVGLGFAVLMWALLS